MLNYWFIIRLLFVIFNFWKW